MGLKRFLRPAALILATALAGQLLGAEFSNPIISGDYPDPTILRVGEDFYMTHTSARWSPGLLIWHSRDLIHWRPVVRALKTYDGDVWAPELAYHQGRFYIFYPAADSRTNHVITAPRIEGTWSAPVDLKIGEIDPGHIVTPEGQRYLYMSKGKFVTLSPDGLSAETPLKAVYAGWPFPQEWRTEGFCLEGPKLFFHDGFYHMISAQGGTAGASTSHMAVEARSRSVEGPWENSPFNPLIKTWHQGESWHSTGHATVFETPNGQWWAIYHGYRKDQTPLGRSTLLQALSWTPDGWLVRKAGTDASRPAQAPELPPDPVAPMNCSDDFAGPELALQWSFWGGLTADRMRFSNHSLVIKGQGKSPADASPMAFCAPDDAYEIEVDVETSGKAVGGLVLFYDEKHFVASALGLNKAWWAQRGQLNGGIPVTLPPSARLKIVCDHWDVDFLIRAANGSWQKVPGSNSLDVSGYHHNTFGGFLSLRPGLYASGEGEVTFRNFTYRRLASEPH